MRLRQTEGPRPPGLLSGEGPHGPHPPRRVCVRARVCVHAHASLGQLLAPPAPRPGSRGRREAARGGPPRLQPGSLRVSPLTERPPSSPDPASLCLADQPGSHPAAPPGAPSAAAVDPAHSRLVRTEPCYGVTRLCPSLRPATDAKGQAETACAPPEGSAPQRDATPDYRPALRCTPQDPRLWRDHEPRARPTGGARQTHRTAATSPLTPTPVLWGPRDRCRSAGPLGTHPWVVEAVTLTTMMVALVRICCRFSLFLHLSRLLPSSWGTRGRVGEARGLRRP